MVLKVALAVFLAAHGAIHLLWASRPPPTTDGPAWPFALDRSWILARLGVGPSTARSIGLALVAVTVGSFLVAAIASLGWLPAGVWTISVALGAIASIAIMTVWFHPWLVVGLGIDALLLWAALVQSWTPDQLPA